MAAWWEDAVVYEIYPRSFQDSDGDGIGDLGGILERLDHLAWLGVDAIWLAPIYRSPQHDCGYDVSDHVAVNPEYGTLEQFDRLIGAAHERGIRVLLDLVVGHTSIEHPWFRERPDYYTWSDEPAPNNWVASFGGPAWSLDERSGRYYLHSFFPEQPDLDWRNPDVREAMSAVISFWLERGVDGFRIDAIDRMVKDRELRDDPPARDPFALPLHPDAMKLEPRHSRDDPEITEALATLREAAGDALLVGEVYLPASRLGRYLSYLDSAFAFDLLHAAWEPEAISAALARSRDAGEVAWVASNHDFSRVATRWGPGNARAATMLLLTLPGLAFLFQGDEIAMVDGPGAEPPLDRFGRDRYRHPMQWSAEPGGGFTTGTPWLPLVDAERRNVADQRRDPDSQLNLVRGLLELRRELGSDFEALAGPAGIVGFRRGRHTVAINLLGEPLQPPSAGEPVLLTDRDALADGNLAPSSGAVFADPE